MIKLSSVPMLDMADFPLCLTTPTVHNTGGYLVSTPNGSSYAYSPIDLLVAGIEASRKKIQVTNLREFFTQNKIRLSEHEVYITYTNEGNLYTHNIAFIKCLKIEELTKLMLHVAPLTFGE